MKIVKIEGCIVCPYMRISDRVEGGITCAKQALDESGGIKLIKNRLSVPDWCPLEEE